MDIDSISTGSRASKRSRSEGQQGIEDFYESKELPESKIQAINTALIQAFVCCGISFSIIDNPFFRELLYQLRPNYTPSSRKALSGKILNKLNQKQKNQIIKYILTKY